MKLTELLQRFVPAQEPLKKPTGSPAGLEPFLKGSEVKTPYGACYRVTKSFPLSERHGHWSLTQMQSPPSLTLNLLDPALEIPLSWENALFLDTETTGLAGGTGTYAFLIGLGYFSSSHFQVEQLLMRDFHEEPAQLYLLDQILDKKKLIITFNGKTFDLPLLETRLALSRLPLKGFAGKDHLDLLHPARRLWKLKLSSCSLNSLEANILGVMRTGDIPGFEIPRRYFDFLNSGDGRLLQGILEHNTSDLLSLPALVYRLLSSFAQRPTNCRCPWEGEALARRALKSGDFSAAQAHSLQALSLCKETQQRLRMLKLAASVHKRIGDYEQARRFWWELLRILPVDLYALEELAKYYEHKAGDLQKAEQMTLQGLGAARQIDPSSLPLWEHRLGRLQRKLKNKTGVGKTK